MATIDREAIEALLQLEGSTPDKSLLEEVVGTYFDASPPLLEKLKSSSATGDLKAVKAAAHSLKSSSALVGATSFSETCRMIESTPVVDAQLRGLVANAVEQYADVVVGLEVVLKDARKSRANSGKI